MSFWSAMVAIAAIIAFANIRMNRDKYRGSGGYEGSNADAAYTASLERELTELRQRLEVLERIATDDGETRRLSREIEQLRDR